MDVVYSKWPFHFHDNDALAHMKYLAENEYQIPVKSDAKLSVKSTIFSMRTRGNITRYTRTR